MDTGRHRPPGLQCADAGPEPAPEMAPAGADGVVYVVDDELAVRGLVSRLIRSIGLRVETFASAEDFLLREIPESPACLVLDVQLPGLSGLDLQRRLEAAGSALPIIFITGYADVAMSVRAMKAGAVEFLTKPFRGRDLLGAILAALERGKLALRRRRELAELRGRHLALSPLERDVMELAVRGMLNKQIAAKLGLAEITVKVHRGRLMRVMGAGSFADLVRMAGRLA
jgi:FixJ family two-component response regulator